MPPIYSKNEDQPVVGGDLLEQLDGLQGAAASRRDRSLGANWVEGTRQFYNIERPSRLVPSFRPQVSIPYLQVMNLSEASDLSESDPVIYLTYDDERREKEEKYIQKIWRAGAFNIENMMALIWAMSIGTGICMVGYDASAYGGRGAPWVKCISAEDFFPDPDASCEDEAQYMQYITYSSKSQLREKYGPRAGYIRERDTGSSSGNRPLIRVGGGGPFMSVPERSSASMSRDIGYRTGFGGSLIPVRTTIIEDFTLVQDEETKQWIRRYPGKRRIVDAGQTVLYDDNDVAPWGMYPFVRFLAIPPLEGFWGVDPTRFSLPLQELAERFYTQAYENAYRTNNATIVLEEGSGLTRENYRGMPAEVVVVKPGREAPKHIWPNPMPPHLVQLPEKLLQMQEILQSRTGAKAGNITAGNLSADLFESAVSQGQPITRMRSKLLARSIQRQARLVFGYMLSRFAGGRTVIADKGKAIQWNVAGTNPDMWEVDVDPASIFPYSGSALRRMIPGLRQLGLIDTKRALEILKLPHAEEIAQEVQREEELGALAGVTRGRRR
ncbi:MAG TPA: hypothetical protein VGT24_01580 [Candidatus Acidoferrales bacterium]|nr:hypothetical protein [Candidatus Acidoferrales bacterium]